MIVRAIDSIERQNFESYEIIIIDDASEETYSDTLNKYSELTPRYIKLTQQSGVSVARNTGMKIARGEWFIFLDDDDEFSNTFLMDMYNEINSHKNSINSFFWSNIKAILYDDEGKQTQKIVDYSNDREFGKNNYSKASTIGCSHGLTVHKTIISKNIFFDNHLTQAEDTDFIIQLMDKKYYPNFLNEIGVIKHNHANKRLSNEFQMYSVNKVYERIFEKNRTFFRQHSTVYCSMLFWTSLVHYISGDKIAGDINLKKYISQSWYKPRNYLKILELCRARIFYARSTALNHTSHTQA